MLTGACTTVPNPPRAITCTVPGSGAKQHTAAAARCVIARAMQICTRAARLWPLTLDGPRPRLGDDRNSVEPGCARCTRPFLKE